MRPLRFVLLVACFIAIPVFLTCISLLGRQSDNADVFQRPQHSRLRALFSFSTPSALFPPSAIISLKHENSTFFLARPAAFGPSLPSKGLSGQLWIGRGFGDDTLLSEGDLKSSGFELGCSDVPGWGDNQKNPPDNPSTYDHTRKQTVDDSATAGQVESQISSDLGKAEGIDSDGTPVADAEDGTDDHLHRPLQDSNPAPVVNPGEPANVNLQEKQQKSTHADIESLQESADIAGKVVLLSRGGCGFLEKVKWAQRRGGVALIVGDNERSGQLTIMYAKGDTSNITIPAIFTSYTSAHLLSSLVPPEHYIGADGDSKKISMGAGKDDGKVTDRWQQNPGPIFTSTTSIKAKPTTRSNGGIVVQQGEPGWMQNVLQVVGLDDSVVHAEDSRRPPGSGNIEWVQVQDWDDDVVARTTSMGTQTSTMAKMTSSTTKYVKQQTSSEANNDDFVIGVQDWRDTELIAPKSTSIATDPKSKNEKAKEEATNTQTALTSKQTNLKGGSIIPGSGEYRKPENDNKPSGKIASEQGKIPDREESTEVLDWVKSWFRDSDHVQTHSGSSYPPKKQQPQVPHKHKDHEDVEGLWVILTPTSVSTSPFFDTLLVLVVSPLVTLTFVYGLLLLRARIRRRRWRAPKSVVERLPVRTYHTMSTASSTTSSSLPTPDRSQAGSPQLRAEPVRVRQRSQTTDGVLSSSSSPSQSPPAEKSRRSPPKRYRGRQIECVVCLEEYVDGESKVMSLPCGHEFHAECITPWLVNRRRTCPICKGDVVRSLQRKDTAAADEDNGESGEETAEDVQERAATTVPDNPAVAAIPIPERQDSSDLMDADVERGDERARIEQEAQRPIASRWRGIINASLLNLSGDTLRASSSQDRSR